MVPSARVVIHLFNGLEGTTFLHPEQGGDMVTIRDDGDPRTMPYRWTGETHFELRPVKSRRRQKDKTTTSTSTTTTQQVQPDSHPRQPASLPPETTSTTNDAKKRQHEDADPHSSQSSGSKVQRTEDLPLDMEEGVRLPESEELQHALREKGPNVVDGVPSLRQPLQGASGSNSCYVPGCVLPGGHEGSHETAQGGKFIWDPYHGKQWATENDEDDSSSSSSTSEELVRDQAPDDEAHGVNMVAAQEVFYVFEMDIDQEDMKQLARLGPRKATVWLSKKMQDKGKEHRWTELPLDRKQDFDMAQAKELSNVLTSKALRSLTKSEMANLDHRKVMNMRWVLTTKSSGLAKARLVILGFQAPNITEVATASPTLSKMSKHMILAIAANLGYRIKSGDITSAFLQAKANLEGDELTVWAPAELAVLYGAPSEYPVLPLRVVRAFYGLVQSPRLWFEELQSTMSKHGWRQITADRCAFILMNKDGTLVGLAGIHVDDYLIAGKDGDPTFMNAEKELRETYNFGKWEQESFEFAGTYLQQDPDGMIHLDQDDYVTKWLEEVELDPHRKHQKKSSLTAKEVTKLRAALGTLSWRATQSAPQFLADVSLLLSEANISTVETVEKVNKLVREVRRTSKQRLSFHCWKADLRDLSVVVWADASNHNRPDKSSTMGIIAGVAPKTILNGSEEAISVIQWKSSKTPRQCLGSNGAEVQAITIGEDMVFHIRALLAEFRGIKLERYRLFETIRDETTGALIMDSRGIYDAATRNMSSLHGLRESRAGYELTLAINQATLTGTQLRWVNGLAQLGDSLTKWQARKAILQFLANGQRWKLVDDPMFVAGKKLGKKALERQVEDRQSFFLRWIRKVADENHWPWQETLERSEDFGGCNHEDVIHV